MPKTPRISIPAALMLCALLLLPSQPVHALLNGLIGSKFPFQLELTNHQDLASDLRDTLQEQRKQSAEFKALDNQRSAARFDRDIIARWLESEGFFDSRVSSDVEQDEIVHTVEPGPRYIIQTVTLNFPKHLTPVSKKDLPVKAGAPLRAQSVLSGRNFIRDHVSRSACLYKIDVTYTAEVDHARHEAFLTYTVADSPSVNFGEITIAGTSQVEPEYLLNYVTINAGECFNNKELELSRLRLLQSNLLSRIEINTEKHGDRVDVTFNVTERDHRTLKAGIGYQSDTGAGLTLGWEHRNLFHEGERFDIESRFNQVRRALDANLVVPHFKRRDQTLTLNSTIAREKPEGYIYTYGEFGATLNRPLSKKWAGNIGVELEFSRDERDGQKEDYALLSSPISVDYNRSNQILNPQNGWVISAQVEPFVDLYNDTNRFVKTAIAVSTYFSARDLPGEPVLALRVATGSTHGEPLENIPSAHRYYVGGGGSVRGYSYQSVGELVDENNQQNVPQGGLSFAETSVELRIRVAGNWGAAIFVDGGYAYPDKQADLGENFLWGAGIGVRYYTSFAPIRFDVATPLDPRRRKPPADEPDERGERIDDPVQLYISIGQAF